jgi:hypothetical protein
LTNSFVEVCVYDVKPDKVDEFEKLIPEILEFQKNYPDTIDIRYMKRTHRFTEYDEIKNGKPSKRIQKIIKSVKYIFYWELKDEIVHGQATKLFFEKYDKSLNKCLLMPGEKYLGERITGNL